MTEQEALRKCADALGVDPAKLGYGTNLIVISLSEELQLGQLIVHPDGRRAVLVCALSAEESALARAYNRRLCEREGRRDGRAYLFGDRPDIMRDVGVLPDGPPAECCWHYLAREL